MNFHKNICSGLYGIINVLVICVLAVGFIACSDNEKNDEPAASGAAELAAGTYKGNIAMTVMGTVVDPVSADVKLVSTDETHVKVIIPELKYNNFTIASVTVSDVEAVKKTDGSVALGAASYTDNAITCNISTGTVSKDGRLSLTFTLQPGKMPMPINAQFTGSK